MSGTYLCPDCDGRLLHLCHPPEYFRRRRLPRKPGLRRLRPLPAIEDVDREEIREADRERWRDESPLFENFAANVDDVDLLRRVEEDDDSH